MGKLYHGSKIRGLTRLEPHKSTHGNYVYATIYKELAIIFSKRCGDDCTYSLYRNSDYEPWILVERIPKAFETMFSNSASIYTLDDKDFYDIHTGFCEVVSTVGVDVECEQFIPNVYDAINSLVDDGKVKLYIYPDKPIEIPYDSSDLIDKQINQFKRKNKTFTRDIFDRLVLLHPYLIDKVNERIKDFNFVPYNKDDLIDLFEKAVIKESLYPDYEQYLNSIIISILNTYPELLSSINEKMLLLHKQNDNISFESKVKI